MKERQIFHDNLGGEEEHNYGGIYINGELPSDGIIRNRRLFLRQPICTIHPVPVNDSKIMGMMLCMLFFREIQRILKEEAKKRSTNFDTTQ